MHSSMRTHAPNVASSQQHMLVSTLSFGFLCITHMHTHRTCTGPFFTTHSYIDAQFCHACILHGKLDTILGQNFLPCHNQRILEPGIRVECCSEPCMHVAVFLALLTHAPLSFHVLSSSIYMLTLKPIMT